MDNSIKEILWRQFGASIDMFKNVISNCPDDYFFANKRFYYIVYHTTVFLDYYLTVPPKDFAPLLPYTFTETNLQPAEAIDDLMPDKFYSKMELLDYIKASREKCKKLIGSLTDAIDEERFTEDNQTGAMDYPILEIILYNMRHIQHHIGQLNMMIRLNLHQPIEWVFQTGENL